MPELYLTHGFALHYLDFPPSAPSGMQAVLLLHGLGATGESWVLQVEPLRRAGFRVLAPDARGFGRSLWAGSRLTITEMAEDMAGLLVKAKAAPAHVIGISMGGTLALQLALSHPELVSSLVLVNTFARLRPAHRTGWLYYALRFVLVHTLGLESQANLVAKRIFPHPDQAELRRILIEQIRMSDPRSYRAVMLPLARFNVEKRLHEIHVPTLVITGEQDTTVPPHNQQFLADHIPAAFHVRIPDGGHGVTADHPEDFNQAVLPFLLRAAPLHPPARTSFPHGARVAQ